MIKFPICFCSDAFLFTLKMEIGFHEIISEEFNFGFLWIQKLVLKLTISVSRIWFDLIFLPLLSFTCMRDNIENSILLIPHVSDIGFWCMWHSIVKLNQIFQVGYDDFLNHCGTHRHLHLIGRGLFRRLYFVNIWQEYYLLNNEYL